MLVVKHIEGQWVEIKHRSGDVIMVRIYDIVGRQDSSQATVAFHDPKRIFEVERVANFDPATRR